MKNPRFEWTEKNYRHVGPHLHILDNHNGEILTADDIIEMLNKFDEALYYMQIRFLQMNFNTNNPNMKITERYKYNKDAFPNEIMDTKNGYGSRHRLIDTRQACAIMNDYENVLRYREEEIAELKKENEELKKTMGIEVY